MAEAYDTRGARRRALAAKFFPINKLPKELLVSVFMALDDPTWVRHTFPVVCKDWAALYRSKDASPLHETLEVDFGKEVERAAAAAARGREGRRGPVAGAPSRRPLVHASRAISWAERRAGSVRKLCLKKGLIVDGGALKYFREKDLGALVAVVAPSLTEISFQGDLGELRNEQFWKSLRDSVVPAGRLLSLVIRGTGPVVSESDVEPLGQLAGSLEELELGTAAYLFQARGLPRFPESFLALKMLRRLGLAGHLEITAIPAEISSLKKLEELDITRCGLSSLPEELGDLPGLTRLNLDGNQHLGNLPGDEAFPAELGKMQSLRVLVLRSCGLRAVPAFIGELESLEVLDLSYSGLRTVPAFVGKMTSLKSLNLSSTHLSSLPKELGELSGLTELVFFGNTDLGRADEVFPAVLGKMKSLRVLDLARRGLRTVPAFVCELKSLEVLNLSENHLELLPKRLGELSGLTKLELGGSKNLGNALPAAEAFPAELGEMKSLRVLDINFCGLRAVPAFVGELESLESLDLRYNDLSSLPKELGELSGLTKLKLGSSPNLGITLPAAEAFPAELGKMKSLRVLDLSWCGLRTVPAFVGELESLEVLNLSYNDNLQIDAPLDFLIEGCPLLREVRLVRFSASWPAESLAHLKAFKAKLRAKNPNAKVSSYR